MQRHLEEVAVRQIELEKQSVEIGTFQMFKLGMVKLELEINFFFRKKYKKWFKGRFNRADGRMVSAGTGKESTSSKGE